MPWLCEVFAEFLNFRFNFGGFGGGGFGEAARIVALLMAPLLPDLSTRMLEQLAQPLPASGADATAPSPWLQQLEWGGLPEGLELPEPSPVMARLELEDPL